MTTNWNEAVDAVKNANSILVVTHMKPDGDAIGSLLGMAIGLREMGKKVDAAVDGGVPDYLRYIPQQETVLSELKQGEWNLMISVDASDEPRTGDVGVYGREHSAVVINLDHHATNTMFGSIHLVFPEAVAASEVVYDFLLKFDRPISQPVATALLTGMVTDTMGFRTNHVVPRTLEVSHQLMLAGGPLVDIINRTMVSKPLTDILLWKAAFPSVEYKDGVISAVITPENLKALKLREMTDAGLVSTLVTPDEVMIAVVFKVQPDNKVELSLRSKVGYDVSAVAFALGGGGHKPAAGATVNGTLEEVKARVKPMLDALVEQGKQISC
jgi:phosphoesterase RecJ-like protein